MTSWLYLNFGEEEFYYIINDQLFFAPTLELEEQSVAELVANNRDYNDLIALETMQQALSKPIVVTTDIGYVILCSNALDHYQVLYCSADLLEIMDQQILSLERLDIKIPGREDVPEFNKISWEHLLNVFTEMTIAQLFEQIKITIDGAANSTTFADIIRNGENIPREQLYAQLRLQQRTHLSVYQQMPIELRGQKIKYWYEEPLLAAWAQPPNVMVSILTSGEERHLVLGQVDEDDGMKELLPPQ